MSQMECEEKTCIVLIGSSGCGKSTFTNLLSNGNVKTSSSSDSCTKKCSIFNVNSNTTLMDTPGFEDSDKSFTDTEIIKKMTTKLGKSKSPKIKIVWCINPGNRKTPSLQKQARLINALGNSIWSSVIIVCRKANMDDPEDNWQGAKYSAKKYSSDIKHCLGITNVSVLNEKVQNRYRKKKFEDRSEDGKYFADEIKDLMFKTLSKIPSGQAKLKKVYHHASTSLTHRNSWSRYAISRQVRKEKRGCPRCDNTNIKRYSWGSDTKTYKNSWYCRSCHKSLRFKGDVSYHCMRCCERNSHSNEVLRVGCNGIRCESCSYTSYYDTEYEGAYTCCLSKSSTGCVTACCHRNPYSKLTKKCGEVTYDPQGL